MAAMLSKANSSERATRMTITLPQMSSMKAFDGAEFDSSSCALALQVLSKIAPSQTDAVRLKLATALDRMHRFGAQNSTASVTYTLDLALMSSNPVGRAQELLAATRTCITLQRSQNRCYPDAIMESHEQLAECAAIWPCVWLATM
jgi:hypothetical protein